jgi:hypothetical protein
VCTHKPFYMFQDDVLKPIHVGKQSSNLNLGYDGDDTGDHISYKNENYCELTALYWIWKNCNQQDIVGLCHYRRFFQLGMKTSLNSNYYENNIPNHSNAIKLTNLVISPNEIIVPEPIYFDVSIIEQFAACHNIDDLKIVEEELQKLFPEYQNSFEIAMEGNILYPYNMFVAHKNIVDSYCSWLFPILFKSEKRIRIPNNQYQRRFFGFVGERLFTVWLFHNKVRISYKEIPVVFFESDRKQIEIEIGNNIRKDALQLHNIAKSMTTRKIADLVRYKAKRRLFGI